MYEIQIKIYCNLEKHKVKLIINFCDNIKRTKYVPLINGSKGIEYLMFVKRRFYKAADKMILEIEKLFEYFNKILYRNAQMEWNLLE